MFLVTALLIATSVLLRKWKVDFYTLLALVMFLWAEFGASLWNAVGDNNFSGLPSSFLADTTEESLARISFYSLSWALLVVSVFSSRNPKTQAGATEGKRFSSPKTLIRISLLSLLIWLVGNGPSIFGSRQYLSFDGVQFVYQASHIAAPLVGLYCLIASVGMRSTSQSSRHFLQSIAVGTLWLIFCLAAGSRTSIFILLGLFFVSYLKLSGSEHLRSRWPSRFIAAFCIPAVAYLVIATFSLTYKARSGTFGLADLMSPGVLDRIPEASVSTLLFELQGVASSLLSAFPITEFSAQAALDRGNLLLALNPLPAGLLGYSGGSADLIFPWLPMSTIGQLMSAFGVIGVMAAYVGVFLLADFTIKMLLERGLYVESLAVRAYSLVILLVTLQYPMRMSSRLVSLLFVLSIILAVQRKKSKTLRVF